MTNPDLPPSLPTAFTGAASTDRADEATLNSEGDEHGRIGYGHYGRFTPLALAVVLIGSLLWIGLAGREDDSSGADARWLVGRAAPDVTLTLLDGGALPLRDLHGSVVLLNFWASWCAPCRDEAPALQAVHTSAARRGEPVMVVGVGLKARDTDEAARAFVHDLGLTYPIGRDTSGADRLVGEIERAFSIPALYPTTVVIGPDGLITAVHIGPLDEEQAWAYVAEGREQTEVARG